MNNSYQHLIVVLIWPIEPQMLDVLKEFSCLSQHFCSPIEIQHVSVYHEFKYLQKNLGKHPDRMTYDHTHEPTDENMFQVVGGNLGEWKDFYPYSQEIMPMHMSEALGKYVMIKASLDANHSGKNSNRISYYGIIIYVNNEPIIWYSKFQKTVQASSFGSEFVVLRIATEMIEDLRYKFRCFEVPVDGPAQVFCNNK